MECAFHTLEELRENARTLIRGLSARKDRATLVVLSGELGAGKTAYVQAVADALGVKEPVTSPTFVLENIYTLPKTPASASADAGPGFKRLVHIDAYRLQDARELSALDFDEIMKDPANLVMLEWPEQVASGLPPPDVSLMLTPRMDGTRVIVYA